MVKVIFSKKSARYSVLWINILQSCLLRNSIETERLQWRRKFFKIELATQFHRLKYTNTDFWEFWPKLHVKGLRWKPKKRKQKTMIGWRADWWEVFLWGKTLKFYEGKLIIEWRGDFWECLCQVTQCVQKLILQTTSCGELDVWVCVSVCLLGCGMSVYGYEYSCTYWCLYISIYVCICLSIYVDCGIYVWQTIDR